MADNPTARPTADDLADVHLISQVKYRYLRCLDQKLFDEIGSCFTEDATASYGGGAYEAEGRDAIVDFLRSVLGSTTMLTSHRVSQPEIDLTGPGQATGTWALNDVVVHTEAGVTIQGAAFYRDEYRHVDGQWLISHTGYRRTYEEIFPRRAIDGLQLTADWWATDGRSSLVAESVPDGR